MITNPKRGDPAWLFAPPGSPVAVRVIAASDTSVVADMADEAAEIAVRVMGGHDQFYPTEREALDAYFSRLKAEAGRLNDSLAAVLDRLAELDAEAGKDRPC